MAQPRLWVHAWMGVSCWIRMWTRWFTRLTPHSTWVIALSALLFALPATAHNGKTAIGVPLSDITIDGDLSDWPDGMRQYPVELVYGLFPSDGDDFTAHFRVGYDAEAIYVAIEVIDDSMLLAPDGAWNTRDGCEVYVDLDHEGPTPARQRAMFARDDLFVLGQDTVVMNSQAGVRSYEWRIPSVGHPLSAGQSIGFDVVVEDIDADHDSYSYISWGPMAVKFSGSGRVGDLLLVSGDHDVGRVDGTLQWVDTGQLVSRGFVEIAQHDQLVATYETGFDGSIDVELSAGNYAIRADSSRTWQPVSVAPGQVTTVQIAREAPEAQPLQLASRGPFRAMPLGGRQNMYLHADAAGNIWHPRNEYLAWYDGRRVVELDPDDLVHPDVNALASDDAGNTWIGTVGGVSRYDGTSFEHFTEELGGTYVLDLAAGPDGQMWIARFGGLTRYDGSTFTSWSTDNGLPSGVIFAVAVDRQQRAWFGAEAGHLGYVQDDQIVVVDSLAGGVWDLTVDKDGTVWAALGRYDQVARVTGDGPVELLDADDGLPPGQVVHVFADSVGATWLMASSGRLIRHHKGVFTAYDHTETRLSGHAEVNSATQDASGRIWFTGGGQVSVYSGHSLAMFEHASSPDSLLRGWSLQETRDGTVWMGSYGGLISDVGRAPTLVSLPRANPWDVALDPKGRFWANIPTPPSIWMFEGDQRTRYSVSEGLPTSTSGITIDDQGELWVTTGRSGIARLIEDRFETLDHRDGLLSDDTNDIAPDGHGGLWVATIEGLSHYDGERFVNYTTDDGLPSRNVTCVLVDRTGTVWAGTQGGAARFDGARFVPLGPEHGVSPDGIYSIDLDRDGVVWLGTERSGAVRFDGTTFQQLTEADGLPHLGVIDVFQDSSGDIWLTMADDVLVRYRPGDTPPHVELTSVIADEHLGTVQAVSFPTTQPFVVFEFEGYSDATLAENLVYAYRLVGHQDEWRQTDGGRVEYRDLPRGAYTFELKAADRDHTYSQLITVAVDVHWPYERLSWIAALSVALCLVAWQTARVMRRDRQLTEQNRQLAAANEQILQATDNKSQFLRRMAHDLRSPMNAIIGYTRLVLRKARGTLDERQVRNLENIQTSSHNLLNLINEILDLSRIEAGRIELDRREFDPRELAAECADALESIVKEGVVLRRDLNDVGMIHSDPDRLRQVIMNLLGNATKFTDAGSITLSLKRKHDAVELSVADTGIGIPPEDLPHIFDEFRQVERQGSEQSEGTGLGLAIARKTVELLGGTISATSEVGVGTTFTVRLPG